MTGSSASASAADPPAPDERILVCGTNWVGDTVMSMPALQALRAAAPDAWICLLAKPRVAPLWTLSPVPDEVLELSPGWRGVRAAARAARAASFTRAYVLPHSVRAALVPWLAGIPLRIGLRGGIRDPLLTRAIAPPTEPARAHQAWESLRLFGLDGNGAALPPPALSLPARTRAAACAALAPLPRPVVGLLPGAARGPAKRWPVTRFAALAQRLAAERECGVVALGTAGEAADCAAIAAAAGTRGLSLAGRSDLIGWAALLAACDLVVANDSGGMHLAAALGVPVVAIFGATDPRRTGPLGRSATLVQAPGIARDRDVARRSRRAQRALSIIEPETVFDACAAALDRTAADAPDPDGMRRQPACAAGEKTMGSPGTGGDRGRAGRRRDGPPRGDRSGGVDES